MSRFVIQPHFRLHEWVAEEKGYFAAEGLDYEFRETFDSKDARNHQQGNKFGAYQTFEKGREGDVSCACHWTVNVAAAAGHGLLYADAYSVSPCAIFVPPVGACSGFGLGLLAVSAWIDSRSEAATLRRSA